MRPFKKMVTNFIMLYNEVVIIAILGLSLQMIHVGTYPAQEFGCKISP